MKNNTRQMVVIAILSAIASVLYAFEIVLPGLPLKIDLSDFPVLIAGYSLGIVPGILVALIKNLIHALFMSKDPLIVGELANFAYSLFVMIPLVLYKPLHKKASVFLHYGGVILLSAFLMHFFNYFVTMPLYGIHEGKTAMLLSFYLPFNLVKASILIVLFYILKPYLNRILK